MNEEKKYHWINDYLKGNLQGIALDEFKQRLKEDPAFAEEVKLQKEIASAISSVREEELRAILKQQAEVKYFSNMWGNKWTYASAAILALFVSLFFIMKNYVPDTANERVTIEEASDEQGRDLGMVDTTEVDTQTLATNQQPAPPPQLEIVEDDLAEEEEMDDEIAEVLDESEHIVAHDLDMDDTIEFAGRTDANGYSYTPTEDVKRDELVGTKAFVVLIYDQKTIETRINENATKDTLRKVESYDDSYTSKKPASAESEVQQSQRTIVVEFWKSPINYKGYRYESGKLKIYGVAQTANITFKELDNRLYVNIDGTYYFIEQNGKDRKFVQVTNEKLLNILNE